MNVVGTINQSSTAPFKTPLVPLRRGRLRQNRHSRLENYDNYNPSFNAFLKDYNGIPQTHNHKAHHFKSTKSLNKRKTFRCTRLPSNHLVVTPAVDMIYKISKRSREVDLYDEVYHQPKRRKLEPKPINNFKDENYICVDSKHELSCQEILRLFDMNDADDRNEKKMSDQNENLQPLSKETKVESVEPVKLNDDNSIKLDIEMPFVPQHTDINLGLSIEQTEIDIKVEENMDASNCELTTGSDVNIYAGQMLWSRYGKYPYWPSIVCPSDTGTIQDTNQRVHVRFCANKGNSGWVKTQHFFEFNGIDSFMVKKQSMLSNVKTKPQRNDFQLAFNVRKYKSWTKAVVEGTFINGKALEVRLAFFDIILMIALSESSKSMELSEIISEFSTRPQMEGAQEMLKENSNICEEIKTELIRLSSTLDFNDLIMPLFKRPTISSEPSIKKERRKSVPFRSSPPDSDQLRKSKRQSLRAISVTTNQLSTSALDMSILGVSSKEQTLTKDNALLKEQKIHEKLLRQVEKLAEFDKDVTSYVMKSYPKNKLFRDIRRGNACKICLSEQENGHTDLVKCSGTCGDYVHRMCVSDNKNGSFVKIGKTKKRKSDFRITTLLFCNECVDPLKPICFVCKCASSAESNLVRCNAKVCGRYYHIKCLSDWLQTKLTDKILCPAHVCHTCVSDDPQNKHYSTASSKLTRCVLCPTTFHIDSCCIPAGSKILTQSHHVCIRHRIEFRKPVNVNWCYICGLAGGMLLCCDACPQSCHLTCLKLDITPERYVCDGCETGRHPLYGEIVWAKLPTHRWWPAIVVPPFCIPDFVENVQHQDHDLCIRFFGSYEFAWIGRSFVYLFDKGDGNALTGESKYDEALIQAENWFNKFTLNKIKKDDEAIESDKDKLLPKPYITIANIKPLPPARLIKGESESQRCNCSPDDLDPCGPMSNCANRACLTECDAELCPCVEKCKNQCIERKIYAHFKRIYMGEKGFGLLAEKLISAGTLVIEYVGELVTEDEFQRRRSSKQSHNFYFMKYMKGLYIDAEIKGNMSRFINHSCNPNCEPQIWSVNGVNRIGLFALVDIPKGTELTFNYEFDDDTHKCFCGELNCKGFIGKKSS